MLESIDIRVTLDGSEVKTISAESAINSDRPRVRRMVSRLIELGCIPLPV
jgi:predicted transcriptional regulator